MLTTLLAWIGGLVGLGLLLAYAVCYVTYDPWRFME